MGGISNAISGDETSNANMAAGNAVASIYGVKLPSIAKMRVKLGQLVQQGVITPEQAQTYLQEETAYNAIDPRAMESQYGALGGLQDIVDTRGMDPQSVAALRQLTEATATQERGQREAILQNAAARGIAGSGIELASKMGAQQGAATSMANQGFQAAADANARHLAALQGIGQLGGQIQGEEAQKASAKDVINQFNTANRQATENMNVGARNQAQAQNLAEKQRISDENIGLSNQQELYNKGLYQQDFANQLAKGQALANANLGAAQSDLGIAEHKTKASDKWSDERLKEGIEEFNPDDFMEKLTGYKYRYKEPEKYGEGDHVGIMAQDLEEVAPQAVSDTPEGKMIDYEKLGGPMLAALHSLNDRISELEEDNG